MDLPQVLIPVIVIAPLLVFIVFAMRRKPSNAVPIPVLQPSPRHTLSRTEMTASRSTTVTRELTLSAKYEKQLVRVLNGHGAKGPLCQLPPPPPFYLGRRAEFARTLVLLDAPQPPRALAITSSREQPGVGRTAFAVTLAHLLAARHPDGQVFIDFQNGGSAETPLGVVEVMSHVVRTLAPATQIPSDLTELPALYERTLKDRRVLVLVENIQPQPYLELLSPPAGSLLILTAREPITFARIETVALEPLSRVDARAFLRASGTRLTREPDKHLDMLAELSGYLPEALRLNATRLQENPAEPIDALFDALKKAAAFKHPLEAARSLAGHTPAPVTRPPNDTEPTVVKIEPLQNGASVDRAADSWTTTRALVQRYQSRSADDFSLTDIPAPFADPSRGPEPEYSDALRLLADFPAGSDRPHDAACLEAAVSAARALKDRTAETRALALLGKARAKAGEPRLAVACFERWVESARESGDHHAEAEALGWLGVGWTRAGFPDRGTGCFDAQLRIAREAGDRGSELHALGKLAQAKATLGDVQNAAALHTEQLAIARETGAKAVELDALENLGVAYSRLKDIEKAAGFHEEQLILARALGDDLAQGRALGHLGQVAVHRGKIEDAIAQYEAQLDLANRIGDPAVQSHAHASLGAAWARHGDLRKAVAHYGQQLQIARQTHNHLGEATAHANIGSGLERLGDLAGAAGAWQNALAIYESLGSPSADSMRRWLERVQKTLADNAA